MHDHLSILKPSGKSSMNTTVQKQCNIRIFLTTLNTKAPLNLNLATLGKDCMCYDHDSMIIADTFRLSWSESSPWLHMAEMLRTAVKCMSYVYIETRHNHWHTNTPNLQSISKDLEVSLNNAFSGADRELRERGEKFEPWWQRLTNHGIGQQKNSFIFLENEKALKMTQPHFCGKT